MVPQTMAPGFVGPKLNFEDKGLTKPHTTTWHGDATGKRIGDVLESCNGFHDRWEFSDMRWSRFDKLEAR